MTNQFPNETIKISKDYDYTVNEAICLCEFNQFKKNSGKPLRNFIYEFIEFKMKTVEIECQRQKLEVIEMSKPQLAYDSITKKVRFAVQFNIKK